MLSIFSWVQFAIGNPIQFLLLLWCLIAIFYYGLAAYAAISFLSQARPLNPDFHPPVSILKPLCGLDRHTYTHLASFCQQDYPHYEIIFGVQDPTDPVILIVQQLIQDFPALPLRLVVSDRTIGPNLKISNLANAQLEARHAILLIADSDIQVGPDYLINVVQPLSQPAVGVVTCMYRALVQGGIADFEALGIATELAPTTLVSRQLTGMTFGIGATIVMRKSVLAAIGGFKSVANYLHDDFHLGRQPTNAGYAVVLSHYVVNHGLDTANLAGLIQHQTRWNRGIRVSQPGGYAGQIFTFGTVASLLFLLATTGSTLGWTILGLTWAGRLTMAGVVGLQVLRDPVVKQLFWLIPCSDLLRFGLWCYGFSGNHIEWRGRHLQLTKEGQLTLLVRVES
jgi:ceramide glucosyltransferase